MITSNDLKNLLKVEWQNELLNEFKESYFNDIIETINRTNENKILCPELNDIFNALNYVSLSNIKVIIMGQDPYHGKGQANGLAFAVNSSNSTPPSLRNIIQEVESDIGEKFSIEKNLISWANQGILLLNSTLTVEEGKANSHANTGWSLFTDQILRIISNEKDNLVFMLWGKNASKKESLINSEKHLILKSVHPSPLSAYKGFFGCKHFSKANKYLKKNNLDEINWTS